MAESDRGHGGGQRLHAVGDLAALTDEDLMLRYRDGEAAAFDVLVRRHRHRVLAFVRRIVKTPHHAEEVLGDVFLKLHRAAPR